jgi:hypothetical protein
LREDRHNERWIGPAVILLSLLLHSIGCQLGPLFALSPEQSRADGDHRPRPFEIVGYGAGTTGGRNGTLYRVTRLDDNGGVGTLRDAISQPDRYIVFDVSGTFELRSNLHIRSSNLTIDGSTAPRGGVQFKGTSVWTIAANEIIVRHVRLRPGVDPAGKLMERGCMVLLSGSNIVVDHISCTWGTDDTFSIYAATPGENHRLRDVTIQHSIIAEGLLCPKLARPGCLKAGRSKGGLFEGDIDRITLYRNLYAHNTNRNPQIVPGAISRGAELSGKTSIELVENVIYDYIYGVRVASVSPQWTLELSMIGNVFKWGSGHGRFKTLPKVPVEILREPRKGQRLGRTVVHLEDNRSPRRDKRGLPECLVLQTGTNMPCDGDPEAPPAAFDRSRVVRRKTAGHARAATLAQVTSEVGATLPCRDAVDRRIVRDTIEGSGSWIDDPEDVGGWANLDLACDHENEPPVAREQLLSGVVGDRIVWRPHAKDPDSGPLTNLTCRLVEASDAMTLAADCGHGEIETRRLAAGHHRFEYWVSDGAADVKTAIEVDLSAGY